MKLSFFILVMYMNLALATSIQLSPEAQVKQRLKFINKQNTFAIADVENVKVRVGERPRAKITLTQMVQGEASVKTAVCSQETSLYRTLGPVQEYLITYTKTDRKNGGICEGQALPMELPVYKNVITEAKEKNLWRLNDGVTYDDLLKLYKGDK